MFSTPVFIVLIVISLGGLGLGVFYYYRPEQIVQRRISPQLAETAKKDAEFKKWFDLELRAQADKTRRMGLIFIILEAVWIIIITSLWQKGGA